MTLLLRLLGLDIKNNFPIALNQGAELCEWRFGYLEEGKLLGMRQATVESARLPHIVRADHGFGSTTIPSSARWMLK